MGYYRIIFNPIAGGGAADRARPRIQRAFDAQSLKYNLVQTERPWHAAELARRYAMQSEDVIVAAGGDGTSNEVINGLMQASAAGAKPCCLGVLSVGRGNDFAYGANIPADLDLAVNVLAKGYQSRIDIGRVRGGLFPQGRYFGNCLGVGFDAIGTIEASKLPRWGGFLSFFVAVLKTIFLYDKAPLSRIAFDGQQITQPSLMISIMNGRRLGGGFWMAPNAKNDDGLFDLCIAHEVSRARILGLIPHFMRGTQASQPEITAHQASKITITALEGGLPAQTDGEILCVDGKQLEVELLPRALNVICQAPGESP